MKRTESQEHVTAWRKSGLSRAAYCREQGLKYGKFMRWIKLEEEETKSTTGKFVALPGVKKTEGQLRISFPNGIRVDYAGVLDERLIQLLQDA